MKTLIIPCAGRSSRFPNMRPKWLLTHPHGNLVIQEAISEMSLKDYNRIIITITKEHVEKFEAQLILEQAFLNTNVEICILDDFTNSQPETVYLTLKKMDVTSKFIVKDSDNLVSYKEPQEDNYVVGLDINTYSNEVFRLKSKSFLILNEQNQIIDIVEKQIKSNLICLGVYGFDSVEKFNNTFLFLEKSLKDKSGLYLSHIIAYLIGTSQSIYQFEEANNFEDWGTLEDWRVVQKKYSTYFVDIDGVILKNCGKFGKVNWYNNTEVILSNINSINKLIESGAQIIFTTSRPEENREFLEKIFEKYNIKYHQIVMGCNHSRRFIINDFAPSNSYPSCVAINIPRNHEIEEYLK